MAGISWSGQAQWSVIVDNFRLFAVGRYPADQDWRLWLLLWLTMCLAGAVWGRWGRWRKDVAVTVVAGFTLRIAIPGLAGQFISLFKDTSLVAIVGMVDLMGISRSILANPVYLGRYAEVYLFVGAVYGLISYGMAWVSYRLEQAMHS
jgi:L-glutamate ABC transporter membrane protein/L-aspartate ABC transporter membrane protein/neutral amino acid ABC transporter membrane protein